MENLRTPETSNDFEALLLAVKASNINIQKRITPTNEKEARMEFLRRPDLTRPNYEYGNMDAKKIRDKLARIEETRQQVDDSDLPDSKKQLISSLLERNEKNNEFVAANYAYNHASTPEEKEVAARIHRETNEAIYGRPDEDTFCSILGERLAQIDSNNLSEDDKKVHEELLKEIGPLKEVSVSRFRPKQETVEEFGRQLKIFFSGFLKHIPDDKDIFSSEEVVWIVNEILENEFDETNAKYRAIIDPEIESARTKPSERMIAFPEHKMYSLNKTKKLVLHELGTHVMRSIPYLNDNITLLSTRTLSSSTFEEGMAMCIEHAISGYYKDAGVEHYISIGLATFKNKNFREVFEICKKIRYLSRDGQTRIDENRIFDIVQRCFMGTGELVNCRDLAYYNGANRVWQYIEKHIGDEKLFDDLFLSGRTDMTDPIQSAWIDELRMRGGI